MKDSSKITKTTKILFIVYLIAIFEIIVFKLEIPFSRMGYLRNINLIPFYESLIVNGKIDFSEIFMNMVIFIPLGIYIEMLFSKWSTIKKISVIFIVSLICEISQFVMAIGASDITDIINNTLGGIVGLLIMYILVKLVKEKHKIYKLMNILATIGTTFMVSLLSILVLVNI
ncbi:VanZ family protein [Romboutsia lituseburensis]|uniref:VanZ family protein n=1 Tax=Romboutsia lituseburensis TaxID=1537 RepID=UPI0022EAE7D2|nr:VanZ family protein [Romboutsia lituseburensis]